MLHFVIIYLFFYICLVLNKGLQGSAESGPSWQVYVAVQMDNIHNNGQFRVSKMLLTFMFVDCRRKHKKTVPIFFFFFFLI